MGRPAACEGAYRVESVLFPFFAKNSGTLEILITLLTA